MGQTITKPVEKPKDSFDFLTILLYLNLFFMLIKLLRTSNIRKKDVCKISLDQIVGLKTVKDEIKYYMKFLEDDGEYSEWNVSVPRGVLLIGPPGTGKTLLIRAMAKSLDIPVVAASGSEFIEKYVGVGASRIRDLFGKARRKKKCIIFIDEIDAIGTRRDMDSNGERRTTLNQLLVEMDGFGSDSNIMVFAATNFANNLDSALLRSGRFDKKVYFDLPNLQERKQMFSLYLDNAPVNKKDLKNLAERSTGLSGADIANVVNQSKINAIQRNSSEIEDEDIQNALDEVMIGREKRERTLSLKERRRVAHHEAGHAILGYLLVNCEPPVKVSIIPRGQHALGFSQQKPDDRKLHTKPYVLSRIMVLLGGRCAESIIYNTVSTGASDDIEKISVLAEHYHTKWGMSDEIGAFNPWHIGFSDSEEIFTYCQNLINFLEGITMQILTERKKIVKKVAKKLLKTETLLYEDLKKFIGVDLENSLDVCDYL